MCINGNGKGKTAMLKCFMIDSICPNPGFSLCLKKEYD